MQRFARILLAGLGFGLLATSVQAYVSPHFKGPGWYQVTYVREDDGSWVDRYIITGPFPDKETCKAGLESDLNEFDNECEFLDSGEDW